MIDYPNILDIIFDKLNKHNCKPIIVGGFVRDNLLNIDSKDIDIEVYGISSYKKLQTLLEEFGSVNSVGKSFGVCKLNIDNLEFDFSLPRVDSKKTSGHSGFEIEIDSSLNFKSAAQRRDFTINAIGYDALNKKILDPYNGIEDLNDSILKAVNKNTFVEDPLRVLRAVQFCSRLNLKMDKELFLLCRDMIDSDMLNELSKERIFEELKKLLLKSQKPSIGFELLREIGAIKYFIELESIDDFSALDSMANILYHKSSKSSNDKRDIVLMLSALFHSFNNDKKLQQVKNFIDRISSQKELSLSALDLIKYLHTLKKNKPTDFQLYKLATKVNISELLLLDIAVNGTNKSNEEIKKRAKKLNVLYEKIAPILKGRDLIKVGLKPSKLFSKILDFAYNAQINSEFNSLDGANSWLQVYLSTNKINL